MGRLQNKVTIITGAVGVIGAAIVRRFIEERCMVVMADIRMLDHLRLQYDE